MKYPVLMAMVAWVAIFFAFMAGAETSVNGAASTPEKILVSDGHVQHNLGNLWNNVTNFGLMGSMPGSSAAYSEAPSARWPGETGTDNLWAASLWVGALVDGVAHVTTGNQTFEMQPTEAAGDTIFDMAMALPGGARYPSLVADDDGDGLEDEDPVNGLDDDGDGLIDEDFGGIGDQAFRCAYSDTAAVIQQIYPDHDPLGISVTQRSFQWDRPETQDFIGYDFTVTNVGANTLDQVYLGLYADFDMGAGPGSPEDDMAGFWSSLVLTSDGSFVPVSLSYIYDGSAYSGVVLCGYSGWDGAAGVDDPVVHGAQIFKGNASFEAGGDPTNDAERYALLSSDLIDPDTTLPSDYRTLISSGPCATLEPGQSLDYQVAMVAGRDLAGLITAAGEAVLTYNGSYFDRDGDLSNGDEYHVPWLRSEDVPAPILDVILTTNPSPVILPAEGGDFLYSVVVNNTSTEDVTADVGVQAVLPDGSVVNIALKPDVHFPAGSSLLRTGLTQTVPGGAPEGIYSYNVRVGQVGGDVLADASFPVVKLGPATGLDTRWSWTGWDGATPQDETSVKVTLADAYPNPFNPVTSIDFMLDQRSVVDLRIYNLRGQRVRTLVGGRNLAAGSHTEIWRGQNDRGETVSAGVYFYRLTVGGFQVTKRVTMVK